MWIEGVVGFLEPVFVLVLILVPAHDANEEMFA
jgi:hypothetical protein